MKVYSVHALAFGSAAAISGFCGIHGADAAQHAFRSSSAATSSYAQPVMTSSMAGGLNFATSPNNFPISAHSNFVVPATTFPVKVSSQVCRLARNGTTASCGATATATYLASGIPQARELSPVATGIQSQDNSVYDYYEVVTSAINNATGGPTNIQPRGIGLSCW